MPGTAEATAKKHDPHDEHAQRLDEFEGIMRIGFERVAEEIRKLREDGSVPVPVLNSILDKQHDTMRRMQRFQAWLFAAVLVYVTGVKFGPEIVRALLGS